MAWRAALVWASGCALPAGAAVCEPDETLGRCWERHEQGGRTELTLRLQGDQRERLLQAETGLGLGRAISAVESFVPDLTLQGVSAPGRRGGEDGDRLSAAWNTAFPWADANYQQLEVAPTTAPVLHPSVRDAALAQANGQLLRERLERDLNSGDDVLYQWTFAFNYWGFGRVLEPYEDRLSNLMLASAWTELSAERNRGSWEEEFLPCGTGVDAPLDVPLRELRRLPAFSQRADRCEALVARIDQAARLQDQAEQRIHEGFLRNRLREFADLVNNQPQLLLSVFKLKRAPLVGPDVFGGRLAFEVGQINLNTLMRDDRKDACAGKDREGWSQGPGQPASGACLDHYRDYVVDHRAAMSRANRIAASLEYARIDDLEVDQPADNLTVAVRGGRRYAASLGFGRMLTGLGGQPYATRLDARVRYEVTELEPLEFKRLVYAVVFTPTVRGVGVPIVLAYADRNEFTGEVDGELQLQLGFGLDWLTAGDPVAPHDALSSVPDLPEAPLRVVPAHPVPTGG